ncbi:MAG: hypothetical protein ABI726_09510 [bacterium]
MSDVDRLLSEYISEHRAGGEADPVAYLDQLEGADREELAALLDAYLQRAPAREWDADAFRGSEAERLTESLHRSLGGRAGLWPVVLPRLRERAQVKRAELVARLGAALGVGDREDKVAGYYHGMEQGSLESDGVSDRVLGALGEIVGASVESLRKAGENLSAGMAELGSDKTDQAFTRMRSAGEGEEAGADEASAERMPEGDWDEVDELFRGRK